MFWQMNMRQHRQLYCLRDAPVPKVDVTSDENNMDQSDGENANSENRFLAISHRSGATIPPKKKMEPNRCAACRANNSSKQQQSSSTSVAAKSRSCNHVILEDTAAVFNDILAVVVEYSEAHTTDGGLLCGGVEKQIVEELGTVLGTVTGCNVIRKGMFDEAVYSTLNGMLLEVETSCNARSSMNQMQGDDYSEVCSNSGYPSHSVALAPFNGSPGDSTEASLSSTDDVPQSPSQVITPLSREILSNDLAGCDVTEHERAICSRASSNDTGDQSQKLLTIDSDPDVRNLMHYLIQAVEVDEQHSFLHQSGYAPTEFLYDGIR